MPPILLSLYTSRLWHRAATMFWRALPPADRAALEARPGHLTLELTNLCNANCVFCPYSQQTRTHERMSDAVFAKAVADYVAVGGGSIDLTPTVGDPLIDPDFVSRVRHLRSFPQIDKITVTTNAILLSRHGVDAVLDSGLTRINVSMAGFDDAMYRRVYRSNAYPRVLRNVSAVLEANSKRTKPVSIYLCLRPDRPMEEVLNSPDLQPLLRYAPKLEFAGTFSRAGGMIDRLPQGMKLAPATTTAKSRPCYKAFSGLVVQSSGDVQVCGCESAINAPALIVGNVQRETLLQIWRGDRLRLLRASFTNESLNANCRACDYYYAPTDLHSPRMRRMAEANRRRLAGEILRTGDGPTGAWSLE